jgi:broad specificity phosphatase PhoE
VIRCVHAAPLSKPNSAEEVRHHFRLLREGLGAWMAASAQPEGMPSYADFLAGVTGALDHVRTTHSGNVLLVSSGGPISTAVGQVLGMAPAATIELNLRIRNSAVSEFVFTPKRHMLLTWNTLPHLDAAEHAQWVTYT